MRKLVTKPKLKRVGSCVNEHGDAGSLFRFLRDVDDVRELQLGDTVHLLCAQSTTFVCFVWGMKQSTNPGQVELTIAAPTGFINKPPYQLLLTPPRTVYRAQHRAIDQCKVNVLPRSRVKLSLTRPVMSQLPEAVQTVLSLLNPEQQAACWSMVMQQDKQPQPRVLQGPPGTGKTTVLAFAVIIAQTMRPGAAILLCAPSNDSVDVICEKLIECLPSISMLRINPLRRDPERVSHTLSKYCVLDQHGESFAIPTMAQIRAARVVACTCSTASYIWSSTPNKQDGFFTHVFIDEAAQAHEPETMVRIWKHTALNLSALWVIKVST